MNRDVILFVEDNPDDVKQTLRALSRNHIGNEVVVARDGAEALEYLFGTGAYAGRDPSRVPGLVLLDLKLPRVSGLEVLERLRADERTRAVPVVVLTSSWEEADVVQSYAQGANTFVRKPLQFTELLAAARHLGLYWTLLASGLALLHREPPPRADTVPDVARRAPVGAGADWPMECLVVTPDPRLRGDVTVTLEALGHRVRHAVDARAALAELNAMLPNLVLVDAALADLPGVEVIRALRSSPYGDSTAVLLVAADVPAARRAIADDAVRVLARPVDLGALAAAARAVGAGRLWLADGVEERSEGSGGSD